MRFNKYATPVASTSHAEPAGAWEQDAKYFYYLHGPLGRSEIGDVKVQGTDYAYTIHGWIKGVNSNQLDRTKDLGKDAQATNSTSYSTRAGMHSNVGQDAYGYVLGYYWDNAGRKDYKPINSAAQSLYTDSYTLTTTSDNLFNGNIKEMSTALAMPNGTGTPTAVPLIFNRYHYDQLNRIKSQTSYTGSSTTSYASLTATGEYSNTFTYDAAGNISTQLRNGATTPGQSMDDLDYYYYTSSGGTYTMTATGGAPTNGTNKLAYVDDAGTAGNYSDDLEDQSTGNYTYDAIGNLVTDNSEGIASITWNVYGKIKTITRTTGWSVPGSSPAVYPSDLEFIYDAFGNRIVKIVKPRDVNGVKLQDEWSYTYYMRDASGNVMSTYTRTYTEVGADVVDKLLLKETHLYGGSRLGIKDRDWEAIYSDVTRTYSSINTDKTYHVTGVSATTAMATPDLSTPERYLGYKQFEFSNHLGNVLVTLSDRKTQVNNAGSIDYFMADVRSYSDYSAFGVALAGRAGGNYRYGFNRQEKDPEIAEGIYTAEYWEYDSRLGRRWNTDPVTYPSHSSYSVMWGNPIWNTDPTGAVVDPGEKGTREYRRNMRQHRKLYGKNEAYTKKYDSYNAADEVYHMRYNPSENTRKMKEGGSQKTENGVIYWDYTTGFSGTIYMSPTHIEWRDKYLAHRKKIEGGGPFSDSDTEHHEQYELTRRKPDSEVKFKGLHAPDIFTVESTTGEVLVDHVKLGGLNTYPGVSNNTEVYHPAGGTVIVKVDSYQNETPINGSANPPGSKYLIFYKKYWLHLRVPVIVKDQPPGYQPPGS